MEKNQVGLFFYTNRQFLVHSCDLNAAEHYGDFLIYPGSHYEIWEKHYAKLYSVDFDFSLGGRVAYRKSDRTFQILYDRCIDSQINSFVEAHYTEKIALGYDEHYQQSLICKING